MARYYILVAKERGNWVSKWESETIEQVIKARHAMIRQGTKVLPFIVVMEYPNIRDDIGELLDNLNI